MNYLKLKQKIYEAIERNPLDRSAYEEMFAVCREYEKIDFQTAHAWNHELRNHISWGLRMTVSCQKFDEAREFDDLMFRSLLFGAQHFFDDYLQAVEYGKPLDKKFYQPRRHYLRRYVDAYQEILDGKLDFLSISMPKRAGKSQLGINFTNMLSGKYPDRATLTPKFSSGTSTVTPSTKKSVDEVAKEVLAGAWGNGDARKNALTAAGYNYSEVQAAVNRLAGGKTTTPTKSITEVAKEVLAGKWGNGDNRKKKLEAAGYNYSQVQAKVNELAKGSTSSKKSVTQIAKEVIAGKWGNGTDRKNKLTAAGYDYTAVQREVNRLL